MTHTKLKATNSLPTRIVTLYSIDYGTPEDGGGTHCPHCGAEGRYVHYFLCDDGTVHAAMSGCIQLFPERKSYLATMANLLQGKYEEMRQAKKHDSERKLASWFIEIEKALESFQFGTITLQEAEAIAKEQYDKRNWWLKKNGYKR